MSRTVFCRKYKEELEGLARPPYPGKLGQDIFENVSQKAWEAWTAHQTLLINEKHLNLMDPASRKFLQEEMEKFMSGDDYEQVEGYVPPSA